MKKILAATDFSDNARYATLYAAHLAEHIGASLLLYHSIPVPLIATEVPVPPHLPQEVIDNAMRGLEKLSLAIHREVSKNVLVECTALEGSLAYDMADIVKREGVDLAVVGIGGRDVIYRYLLGTNTMYAIRYAGCPVLVIPPDAVFTAPKRLVLAVDYHSILRPHNISLLKEFTKTFNSKVLLLHISDKEKDGTKTRDHQVSLIRTLKEEGIDTQLFDMQHKLIVESIHEFAKLNDAGLIVMVPRAHPFFQKMFSESTTKKMLFETNIPVLTLPE